MLLHINPTRQRGKRTGSLARALGWYLTFFAAGVIDRLSEADVEPIIAEERRLDADGLSPLGKELAPSARVPRVLRVSLH